MLKPEVTRKVMANDNSGQLKKAAKEKVQSFRLEHYSCWTFPGTMFLVSCSGCLNVDRFEALRDRILFAGLLCSQSSP